MAHKLKEQTAYLKSYIKYMLYYHQ